MSSGIKFFLSRTIEQMSTTVQQKLPNNFTFFTYCMSDFWTYFYQNNLKTYSLADVGGQFTCTVEAEVFGYPHQVFSHFSLGSTDSAVPRPWKGPSLQNCTSHSSPITCVCARSTALADHKGNLKHSLKPLKPFAERSCKNMKYYQPCSEVVNKSLRLKRISSP